MKNVPYRAFYYYLTHTAEKTDEENISTQQTKEKTATWFPCKNAYQSRTQRY